MARLGPKKQRLTRAEWKAQKEHAMKVAAAESAVLDSAATKEKEAHKRLQAVQEHAELLAKEKRATREAMQKALALQAEAREKIAQSEALLAQYGLADVAPTADASAGGVQGGSNRGVRAMSAYQSNGKVAAHERSQLHHINKDSRESAPAPCSRMGAMHKTRARRLRRLFMPSATSIQARA